MIAVILALQLAAGAPVLKVRAPGSEADIPVVRSGTTAAVAAHLLAPVIPISVSPLPNARFAVTFPGVEMSLTDRVPFATVRGTVVPLTGAPFVEDGRLYLPLQLVTDLLPRYVPSRLRYDRARGELRLLSAEPPPRNMVFAPDDARPARSARAAAAKPTRLGERRRVVVDAGHGGPDDGMTGPIGSARKIREKDITLAVAKKLASELRDRELDVVMTRTRDTLIALSDRGRIANEQKADLFISIHVNAANLRWKRPQEARGVETYFLAEAKTEDAKRVEQMENDAVRFETGASAMNDDPLSFIIKDMAQNEHLRESSELADIIQRKLVAMHPGPDRGVKQAGFRVLVTAYMPAVLVEIGFGTNREEARFLADPKRQTEIAEAIADAAVEYVQHYERRLGTASP
jgi:N-acetylmuramoyl-L-alanine amidase